MKSEILDMKNDVGVPGCLIMKPKANETSDMDSRRHDCETTSSPGR